MNKAALLRLLLRYEHRGGTAIAVQKKKHGVRSVRRHLLSTVIVPQILAPDSVGLLNEIQSIGSNQRA